MARNEEAVKVYARRLLPVNRGAWVVDRALASIRKGTARLGDGENSPQDPDLLWAETKDRGRGRHAHGFTFFADWIGAALHVGSDDLSTVQDRVHATVLAWDERFGSARETAPEMAYHDETTAQRLLGVVAAIDILELDETRRADLVDFAARTAAVLAEPEFHSGLNNHGMFQDLALLTWSILVADGPDDEAGRRAWELAEARLDKYFETCFTAEGVHVENTPTYHVMVSRYLPVLAGIFEYAGTPSAQLYSSLLAGAERYAIHSVTPEGLHPPVSDTQRRRLDTELNLETFPGGMFEYAATAGSRGTKPPQRTAAFPASGYAMSRSAWGQEDASFVYFTCAYNADYHKHSDEQSIFLRSAQRDLLCEAGPYGYNWKDPLTKYAYSSAAHNSMLVDGKGLPRTEPRDVRTGDLRPLNEMRVDVAEDDLLEATGTTRRYPGRSWTRRLRVTHGDSPQDTLLRVTDEVRSSAGAAKLSFLWHFGPGLTVVPRPRGAEVFDGSTKVMEVEVLTEADLMVGLVEGEELPVAQGWYFPAFNEKTAAPVLTVDCWQQDVTIDTEFRLSEFTWGDTGRETLESLVAWGPPVPSWSGGGSPTDAQQAVVLLAPYESVEGRDRFTAELVKAGIPHRYLPGISGQLLERLSPDAAARAMREIGEAVTGAVRAQTAAGLDVLIATVGAGFAPGAIAALSTGSPLIGLDPALPLSAGDARTRRLSAQLAAQVAMGAPVRMQLLVTSEARDSAHEVLRLLESVGPVRHDLTALLAADVEECFSDVLRNALEAESGEELRYLIGYDRRARRFVIELLDVEDVMVAVRAFHGKQQTASMPYTAGSRHTLDYEGHGPHRLRIHVRDAEGNEISAFTTGVIRVR